MILSSLLNKNLTISKSYGLLLTLNCSHCTSSSFLAGLCSGSCVRLCYLVVVACTEEDVVSSRVPLNKAHSAAVTLKLLPWCCEVLQHTMRRDFPHFNLHVHINTHQTHTNINHSCSMRNYMIQVYDTLPVSCIPMMPIEICSAPLCQVRVEECEK